MRRIAMIVLCLALLTAMSIVQAQSDDVVITSPEALAELSGVVEITGTVNPSTLRGYYLEVAPSNQNPASATWTPVTLGSGRPVTDGVLGEWDTTTLPDGSYTLRLRVVLTSGETDEVLVRPLSIANAGAASESTEGEVSEGPTLVPRPQVQNELPLPVGGQMDTLDETAAELLSGAGITWMKWQIPYTIGDASLLDVARDRINWTHEHGFLALLSIKGSKDELAAVGAEEYFPLFADFVAQIAAMHPDAIQVWNEQNFDREWPVGQINGEIYVDLLRQTYDAIKAVDDSIMVITGAPGPTGFFGGCGQGGCDDDAYYAQMARAGAAQYADCIGVHYNEGILPPTQLGGDPRGEYPTHYFTPMLQRAAASFRGQDVSFCYSEMGYISPDGYDPLPAAFAWGQNNTVQEQAEWLRDAIQIAADSDIDVALIIIFNANFTRYVEDDPQGAFAIIRPDGSCPACDEIATLRQPQ
jgi:hypothetical protein